MGQTNDVTDDNGPLFGIWYASIVENSEFAGETIPIVLGEN